VRLEELMPERVRLEYEPPDSGRIDAGRG
jgi:hypothetical protein